MIFLKLQGWLGNQMFKYALGIAVSIHHNAKLILDIPFLSDYTKPNMVIRAYSLHVYKLRFEMSTP